MYLFSFLNPLVGAAPWLDVLCPLYVCVSGLVLSYNYLAVSAICFVMFISM